MATRDLRARRWRRASLVASVAVCLAGCGGAEATGGTARGTAAAPVVHDRWATVGVEDVVTTTPYDGVVAPVATVPVVVTATGTVTRLAPVGTALEPGAPLAHVDERPVVALPGAIPVFRDLVAPPDGVLQGEDVAQLQRYLSGAGFFRGKPDGRFTPALGAAVRSWRVDRGLGDARGLTRTEVVFVAGDGPWTVTEHGAAPGAAFAGGVLLEVSQGALGVAVALDGPPPAGVTYRVVPAPTDPAGVPVPLEPVGAPVRGDDGSYGLVLVATGGAALPVGPGGAVVVEQTLALATGVLVVPVAAVRLDPAGDPVVRCRPPGDTAARDCPVVLGASDGAAVEIREGLQAGYDVAVAP